jgi:hypothetical protein
MIGTIGFLVQEASNRVRWLVSVSLYVVACISTAVLLGALLGALGHLLRHALRGIAPAWLGVALVGLLAIAYALSDLGVVDLPRPTLMHAVPATWWRWWQPYGAALAYGAALGLGVTTRIYFGSFYVVCAWCILQGDVAYGALLLGAYGAARALVMFPISWGVYGRRTIAHAQTWLASPLFSLVRAQTIVAAFLIVFGAQAIASMLLPVAHPLLS